MSRGRALRDSRGRFAGSEPGSAHLSALLGGQSISAVCAVTGGFTPGHKRIVVDEEGRSLFVKFAPAGSWMASAYAKESAAHEWLPQSASGGLLVTSAADAEGTTLVFHAVQEPDPGQNGWTSPEQFQRALRAMNTVFGDLDDSAPDDLPSEVDFWTEQTFWRDCDAGIVRPPTGVNKGLLSALARSERNLLPAMTNAAYAHEVSHHDLRRDNILIAEHGVFVIDWNWVNRSSRVGDAVGLGIDAAVSGLDPELALSQDGPFGQYDEETVNAALAGLTGYYASSARVTAGVPRALTSLRRASAAAGIAWLERRVK